jgi:hypothetical protein
VAGRRIPMFTVFGAPMTNCYLLMDECPPDQIVLTGETKNLLPQVFKKYLSPLHEKECIKNMLHFKRPFMQSDDLFKSVLQIWTIFDRIRTGLLKTFPYLESDPDPGLTKFLLVYTCYKKYIHEPTNSATVVRKVIVAFAYTKMLITDHLLKARILILIPS